MSTQQPWYRRFGDVIAPAYAAGDEMAGGGGTAAEVAFIQRAALRAWGGGSRRILDVGCGTGRHARALAALGHQVTGLDCSPGLLAVARTLAAREGLREGTGTLTWLEADARDLRFAAEFDLALSLYGGAFGVGQDEADDEAVLHGIARALRPGGALLLTATHATALVAGAVERAVMTGADETAPAFDPATFTTHTTTTAGPDGRVHDLPAWWRAYTPRELTLLCRLCGLRVDGIYGCAPGDWQRQAVRLDHADLLVIGHKPKEGHL